MTSGTDATSFIDANYLGLSRLARALTANPADANDLLHDTLERLYRKWRTVQITDPWAMSKTIMVRLNIDRFRRTRREILCAHPSDAALVRPAVGVGFDEELVAALAALAPKQRTVVVLRYMLDMAVGDIATTMRTSEATVRSNSSRGLANLREHLIIDKERLHHGQH